MSYFRNPRFGLLPGAPRGANPVAPPLQNPNVPSPQGVQVYTSSADLTDGTPKLLAKYQCEQPSPIGLYVCAPRAGLPNPVIPFIPDSGGAISLSVLGKCTVGCGGTTFSYEFDMPPGQMVQLQHEAQYIEVQARLILTPADAGNNLATQNYLFPPLYTGRAQNPVRVFSHGGPGVLSGSNATRRARFVDFTAKAPGFCAPPEMATELIVVAKSNAELTFTTEVAIGSLKDIGPITPINPCCPIPIPQNCTSVKLAAGGADTDTAELVWRLGFTGTTS